MSHISDKLDDIKKEINIVEEFSVDCQAEISRLKSALAEKEDYIVHLKGVIHMLQEETIRYRLSLEALSQQGSEEQR